MSVFKMIDPRSVGRLFRSRSRRRGTVLLMALGVLGILALAGVSYVTIVRLDRASALTVARESSYEQQVEAVVAHMQDLLAADLFGGKIVTTAVPLKDGSNRDIWPRMFENGESRTFPSVELSTFNTAPRPNQDAPQGNSTLPPAPGPLGETALPDHAWLAFTEPEWDPRDPEDTTYWRQITNLRGAWVYRAGDPRNTSDDRWVRGDGRFVDLGEWFLQARANLANAGANLIDWSPAGIPNDPNRRLGPEAGIDQPVFDRQLSRMSEHPDVFQRQNGAQVVGGAPADERLNPQDERQWADADGDLRPDSRWQQLESLGNLFGLSWFVAARMIDASSLININSAIEFGDALTVGNPDKMGDGATPADVDLFRFLSEIQFLSNPPGVTGFQPSRWDRLEPAYSEHLADGIGINDIIAEAVTVPRPIPQLPALNNLPLNWRWTVGTRLDRAQRRALWEFFGASPDRPPLAAGTGYPMRDLIDLMAFAGTNYPNIVSKTEQRFDGPEASGYLPGGVSTGMGPLRSREAAVDSRRWDPDGNAPVRGYPTAQQIRDSRRRLLTTVSGAGDYSPVPVLNPAQEFAGRFHNTKVKLEDLKRAGNTPGAAEPVQRTFESFVWALAPLITDQPLAPNLPFGATSPAFHYGGINHENVIVTAASLTANLRDALDGNLNTGPCIIRLANDVTTTDNPSTNASGGYFELGTRLSQGDIAGGAVPGLTPFNDPSNPDVSAAGGLTVVGLDRQPFLRSAVTMAFYSGTSKNGESGNDDALITANEGIGSAFAVELVNPWSRRIGVTEDFVIVIPDDAASMGGDSVEFFPVATGSTVTIEPGGVVVFYWVFDDGNPTSVWSTDFRPRIINELMTARRDPTVTDVNVVKMEEISAIRTTVLPVPKIPFQAIGNRGLPVLLMRDVPTRIDPGTGDTISSQLVLLDRLSTPVGAGGAFPATADNYDLSMPNPALTTPAGGFAGNDGYFQSIGYDILDAAVQNAIANNLYAGRLVVTSEVVRPGLQSTGGGFPAYVVEFPNATKTFLRVRYDAHAWFSDIVPGTNTVVLIDDLPGTLLSDAPFPADFTDISIRAKAGDDPAVEALIPPFQLYVPNDEGVDPRLNALSELHMLSMFAHTCRNNDVRNFNEWQTVSEKLGLALKYDLSDPNLTAALNPYLGVLDPTKYILTPAGVSNLPHTMAVPLATRVFECFEPLDTPARLAQGRINVNTAPQAVLEMLPLIAPAFDIGGPTPVGLGAGIERAREIVNYRGGIEMDPVDYPMPTSPPDLTALTELRLGAPAAPGFANIGELAILDEWDPTTGNPVGMNDQFLALADPLAPGGPLPHDLVPLQVHERTLDFISDPANAMTPTARSFNPADDPEERLAIFRAISNIVTTRSDVFIAWFILRGYNPDVVERIPTTGTGTTALRSMDPSTQPDVPRFEPAYESRWLVVFDRSNIQRPTDRPNVLLKVELPRAVP